ncbi:MAG: hypothetical protein KAK04_23190 [Cyclobacteriaceae bacterium]|nr:hypothetical protein [Cyclobacteriaceae bacterium]
MKHPFISLLRNADSILVKVESLNIMVDDDSELSMHVDLMQDENININIKK